ncbi:hypothetical protein [Rhizobium sp. 9140]|uniref:hypothetical protein n=1 Tax=Rhizobium sp. 9140 TaxID=1761900 RepID=UPI00079AB067|nr:hypothetical protein [Rhizobium sp. 9140]CZT33826.1 hypothetical protein GA0004734_00008480 [Rhizobium sp. 9140]
MTGDRDREPYIAPSADAPEQTERKSKAGKGIVMFIAVFAIAAFLMYLSVLIYASIVRV